MPERVFNPRRLDVAAFARAGATLQGQWPLASLERLAACAVPGAPAVRVAWSAAGSMRPAPGAPAEVWVHLSGSVQLPLQCQRCLQALDSQIVAEARFRFVPGEDEAARLDAEAEEDVLSLSRELDLQALLEDELLLALPLVPRHERCPQPLASLAGWADEAQGTAVPAHPFAGLAALRKRG